MEPSFSRAEFHTYCDHLAKVDPDLKNCLEQYGYPPLWSRKPSFETLIHIILEQQVSLASAKSALLQLKKKTGPVTATKLSKLSDADLKACYFSRQKIIYARHLTEAVISGKLVIKELAKLSNEEVRSRLTSIKGIGNWTTDVFLMMVLHRNDVFPVGDLALMQSVRHVKQLPAHSTREEILAISEKWKPYRTIAAFIFWYAYIRRKNISY
jgi:DNA-3-methyladenine glycosylase II